MLIKIVAWVFGVLAAIALFLFLILVIGSMVGVLGDVFGWWDGWVSDR